MRSPAKLGRLIVLEGIDGAGTTTQARMLTERIRDAGTPFWSTNEPTDSPIGLLLRQVLGGDVPVTPDTAAYLFATDRWEHVYGAGGIIEHHDAGDVVVCDRYYYSSLVYQSIQGNPEIVSQLNGHFPDPALVIFVDLSIDLGEERLARRRSRDIYENRDFQLAVRDRYLSELEAARMATRVSIISGADSADTVHRNIWEAVGEASILNT